MSMKIYKEKQFLIFEFPDGKTVKYDFATKTTIGKRGKKVNNLCSQLNGLTINDVIKYCTDEKYAKFLKFVKDKYSRNYRDLYNIGSVLEKIPMYSRYEQLFSAGVDDILDLRYDFSYKINDIPKGLIKLCRNHNIKLTNELLESYKQNPDRFLFVFNQNYDSLISSDICQALLGTKLIKEYYGQRNYEYQYVRIKIIDCLIKEHNYTIKGLMSYLDYLFTYEAIEEASYTLSEIYDYANMMSQISNKFDKYPRHFLTTHKIACRNYNRLKQQFEEEKFKQRINKNMEKRFGDYIFIYPECVQDIKDEAVSQNNCVASYIQRVIDGQCDILFLRHKDRPSESLVTIEVRNNKIVQAKQKFNYSVTPEQQEIIDKWNSWWANKTKII